MKGLNSTRLFAAALIAAATLLGASTHAAETRVIQSTGQRVPLLELYTSEGCSSCPPADRWLSELTDDPRLWKGFVPVALHVNYWDRLGWPDRFASPTFSGRQRAYARVGAVGSVYTPGFVLDGQEWRAWFRDPTLRLPPPEAGGDLKIKVTGNQYDADYMPASRPGLPVELYVAVLGFGLETEVRAGENAGRKLVHDFVVMDHAKVPLGANHKSLMARGEIPDTGSEGTRRALVAWVQLMGDPRPLQATGGWLD